MNKLVVITGTTACGKSDLAVELAKRFGAEVVSADSRQVFRGLDLGSGKITTEEMQGIPHHLLDRLIVSRRIFYLQFIFKICSDLPGVEHNKVFVESFFFFFKPS